MTGGLLGMTGGLLGMTGGLSGMLAPEVFHRGLALDIFHQGGNGESPYGLSDGFQVQFGLPSPQHGGFEELMVRV